MTAADLKTRYEDLLFEQASAVDAGLSGNDLYMNDLRHEMDVVHAAYVGMAVTEIACLRARLGAPLLG